VGGGSSPGANHVGANWFWVRFEFKKSKAQSFRSTFSSIKNEIPAWNEQHGILEQSVLPIMARVPDSSTVALTSNM
jgi:hypothetical protein